MVLVLLAANADVNAENMVSRIICVYVCPKIMLVFVCLFVHFELFDKRFFIFYILYFLFVQKEKRYSQTFYFLFFCLFYS